MGWKKKLEMRLNAASIEEMVVILRKYRDQGTTAKQATEPLEAMRAGADEETEDRLLEILDVVSGFCRTELRVWSDPQPQRKHNLPDGNPPWHEQ